MNELLGLLSNEEKLLERAEELYEDDVELKYLNNPTVSRSVCAQRFLSELRRVLPYATATRVSNMLNQRRMMREQSLREALALLLANDDESSLMKGSITSVEECMESIQNRTELSSERRKRPPDSPTSTKKDSPAEKKRKRATTRKIVRQSIGSCSRPIYEPLDVTSTLSLTPGNDESVNEIILKSVVAAPLENAESASKQENSSIEANQSFVSKVPVATIENYIIYSNRLESIAELEADVNLPKERHLVEFPVHESVSAPSDSHLPFYEEKFADPKRDASIAADFLSAVEDFVSSYRESTETNPNNSFEGRQEMSGQVTLALMQKDSVPTPEAQTAEKAAPSEGNDGNESMVMIANVRSNVLDLSLENATQQLGLLYDRYVTSGKMAAMSFWQPLKKDIPGAAFNSLRSTFLNQRKARKTRIARQRAAELYVSECSAQLPPNMLLSIQSLKHISDATKLESSVYSIYNEWFSSSPKYSPQTFWEILRHHGLPNITPNFVQRVKEYRTNERRKQQRAQGLNRDGTVRLYKRRKRRNMQVSLDPNAQAD